MTNEQAWTYAASWGSYIRAGDPGACLYGFDERFEVQSEQHRADCLAQMVEAREHVMAAPDDYDPDELAQIDALELKLKAAPLAG